MTKIVENSIYDVFQALTAKKMIVIIDEDSREGEGDLMVAAQFCDVHHLNFMLNYGRGIICVPLHPTILDKLEMLLMVQRNTDRFNTPFCVSVDYIYDTTTGVSVFDRVKTIRMLVNTKSKKSDFTRPGHVFPLRSHKDGIIGRQGHTEASIELVRLADLSLGAVICEILKPDGSMANRIDCYNFAKKFDLNIISTKTIFDHIVNKQ